MAETCNPLPVLETRAGARLETNCAANSAGRKFFDEYASATALVRGVHPNSLLSLLSGSGSGSFFDDGTRFATNYHVIRGQQGLLDLQGPDGQVRKARIEKIDPIADLAILKLEPHYPSAQALKLGTSTGITPQDRLASLGHPKGRSATYLSEGSFVNRETVNHLCDNLQLRDGSKGTYQGCIDIQNDAAAHPNPQVRRNNQAVLNQELMKLKLPTEPGSSGSPTINVETGEQVGIQVRGVSYTNFSGYRETSWSVPVERLKELHNQPSEFNFEYGGKSDSMQYPVEAALAAGAIGAFSFVAPKLTAGGFGAYSLWNDGSRLLDAHSNMDRLYHATGATSGALAIAGSLAMLVARSSPVGNALLAGSALAWAGQKLVPYNLALSRITDRNGQEVIPHRWNDEPK